MPCPLASKLASLSGSGLDPPLGRTHCKVPISNGVDWPAKIFGALGLVLIVAGLVPPYIDIYKERRVRGFSFIFLLIDMGGAFFSLLSLCRSPRSDRLLTEQSLNSSIRLLPLYILYLEPWITH